jgi:hypothetical protein
VQEHIKETIVIHITSEKEVSSLTSVYKTSNIALINENNVKLVENVRKEGLYIKKKRNIIDNQIINEVGRSKFKI